MIRIFTTGFVLAFLFLAQSRVLAQTELDLYRNIYRSADSMKAAGLTAEFDKSVYKKAQRLDKGHPAGFFEASGKLLNKGQFNEAAFLYYLGIARYDYFLSVKSKDDNPEGIALGALRSVLGEPVLTYLKTDIDNYITTLQHVIEYYKNNDARFFSRKEDPAKYNKELDVFTAMIKELKDNREKYVSEWREEEKKMRKVFNVE